MKEVNVSTSRRLSDAGIEKTVLDTAVLHDNIAYSMADILGKNSTLFIKSYGRATESTAEFRGTSPSHTQVMWNGMKINSPMLGTVDFSYIPAYFVDETTLLHGASSVCTTDGGLGGAIELTTKPIFEKGFGMQYTQGVGSFSTYDQFLRLTYGNEHWSSSTRVAYSHSKNDFKYTNYDKKVDERDETGKIVRSYHPTERNKSGYFDDVNVMQDVYYNDLKGNRYGAMLWYGYSLRGLPFLSVDYKTDNDFTNEHEQQSVRALLKWDRTKGTLNVGMKAGYAYQNIGYEYSTNRQDFTTDITNSRSYAQTGFVHANADYAPSQQWFLSASASLYYNHVKSWDRSPFHIGDNYNQGRMEENLAVSAKWRPLEPLTMNVVLRETIYKDDIVPVIPAFFIEYVAFKPINLTLKASVTRNYRYPTLDDLYYKPGGNPQLKPEYGFTYDGGIEFAIKRKRWNVSANVTAFNSHITDWILWTPNSKGYWQPSNIKKVHNYGVEAMLGADWAMGRHWRADVTGNFAYTPSINEGEKRNSNDASYGKQLCYVPRVSANINTKLHFRSWTLGYQWVHYSERYTTTSNEVGYITGKLKPYYMSDISLEKAFRLKKASLSLKAQLNNILGTEYVTVLSRPMAGRNFEVFLEIKY